MGFRLWKQLDGKRLHKNYILSGEAMYFGYDLSMKECVKDFELLGYTHEESIELAKLAIDTVTLSPIDWYEFIEAFNSIGCTSFRLASEELENLLKE